MLLYRQKSYFSFVSVLDFGTNTILNYFFSKQYFLSCAKDRYLFEMKNRLNPTGNVHSFSNIIRRAIDRYNVIIMLYNDIRSVDVS